MFSQQIENLNDVTLYYGKDLYGEERLNLKNNFSEVFYQSHDDWNHTKGNTLPDRKTISS